MSDRKESGGFLNRWSLRKQQVAGRLANEDEALEAMTESELPGPVDSMALLSEVPLQGEFSGDDLQPTDPAPLGAAMSEHGIVLQNNDLAPVEAASALLTDADMPDIETLTASSDISGFLDKGVSAALRKAALRHVFSQPKYNVRDGLDDYDDDYTKFEPLGDTVTSDMKFHATRKERARLESERLAEQQMQTELDMPDGTETAQDSTSTLEKPQADKPAQEDCDADQEGTLDDNHECHKNTVALAENDAAQDTNLLRAPLPDQRPNTDNPLRKTSQATASQPREIPNE